MKQHDTSKASINRILSKFRNDDVGNMSRKDEKILLVGSKLYKKLTFKKEKISTVAKSVRSNMRILGKLHLYFKSIDEAVSLYGNSVDLFLPQIFEVVCAGIDTITLKEDGERIKPGLRQNIFYAIKKAVKIIRAHHAMKANDDIVAQLERFQLGFNDAKDFLVSTVLTVNWKRHG